MEILFVRRKMGLNENKIYDMHVQSLVRLLSFRDLETKEHTRRVTAVSLRFASLYDLPKKDLIHMRRGALLHDIGKVGIPDSILHKDGALTAEERAVVEMHPVYAYEILRRVPYLRPALDIPYCHHEKWDGTGYPRGLRDIEIPIAARLFAIVDVWDALLSDRPYRPAWTEEKTIAYIYNQSEKHFDPEVVRMFDKFLSYEKSNNLMHADIRKTALEFNGVLLDDPA